MDLFRLDSTDQSEEQFDILFKNEKITIERIVSYGQTSQEWYDQAHDEWVCILEGEGELLYEDGTTKALKKGEYCFIPARRKHKVSYTSSPTIWLAIHF